MFRFALGVLITGTGFLVGCTPGSGNAASELEGVWQLNFEEPGDLEGYDIQATFDSRGQLKEINAASPEGGSATLDVSDDSTTTVDDHDVTITIPRAGGTTVYEGTLSDDNNTIEGNLSQALELPSGDINVTLPGSGLTLVRLAA
jgi:hypothetical protein